MIKPRLLAVFLGAALVSVGCNRQQSTTPVSTPNVRTDLKPTIYVPGQDDRLHVKNPSSKAVAMQTELKGDMTPVLQEIIEQAPQFFPPRARVNHWQSDGKTVILDLDKSFDNAQFWSQKGEKTTELAIYALVNTAAGKNKLPVSLALEGQPLSSLGEFDVSGQIETNMKLVAVR